MNIDLSYLQCLGMDVFLNLKREYIPPKLKKQHIPGLNREHAV